MIYLLLDEKRREQLTLKGEEFKYLIKARRHSVGDVIAIRFREDLQTLCRYTIVAIENRSVELELLSFEAQSIKSLKKFHIAWCIIDPKSIEKVLPTLSEIGVWRISFIACDRSQKNFKLDFKRFERILEASMQQCGRSSYIEFDTYKNIASFIKEFPQTKVLDFCENVLSDSSEFQEVLIGSEGGFSSSEKELFNALNVFRLDTPMVLRSESAVVAVASKVLL